MYQGPGALLKLIGPLCLEGGRRRDVAEFAAAAQPVWQQVEPGLRAFLLSLPTEMSIDPAARAVLVQYPYADRRALCTAWLAGEELSPKDRERIGAKQMINNESAAKYVLCALCRLLTAQPGRGGILTFAYDQTDTVAEQWAQAGVQIVAEVISAIQSQGGSAYQVLSCRPETWKMLQDKPTRPGPGQLKIIDDTLQLGKLTAAQLRELVLGRAGKPSVLSAAELDPASWPKDIATPRAALAHAAKLFLARTGAAKGSADKESVPVVTTDAPTAKGLPSSPVKAPAPAPTTKNAAAPAASAKNAPSKPGVQATSTKNAPSQPGAAAATGKAAASKPDTAAAAKSAPNKPAAASAKNAPSTPPVVAEKEPPSAASPSVTWMAMASDDESLVFKDTSTPAKPAAKKTEPKKPAPKPALEPVSAPPPSAQSPSVTWMAMASDDDPLAQALAAAAAKEQEEAARRAAQSALRTTKERLPSLGAAKATPPRPDQVMSAFGSRDRVEEWLLAKELGVPVEALADPLSRLEDQGTIRLVPLRDGQRLVVRL
jgi:hypothetical protein